MLKNTLLIYLMIMLSCGNQKTDQLSKADERTAAKFDSTIVAGADQIDKYLGSLKGKRIGIVANQTSVVSRSHKFQSINPNKSNYREANAKRDFIHLVDTLLSLNFDIRKVFAPEHGFRGVADAGELVADGIDNKTGLPLLSLHGKHKKPTPSQLDDLDLMIFDIQDVGVRFYTYISTLHYIMEACAEQDIPLLILDRPNPNGSYTDGPTMKAENTSFLGMHTIPLVHGMTIGEYAQMINGEKWLINGVQCQLEIIKVAHYAHDDDYSLPIKPSPNLPNNLSIKLYPSLGLFEGTNINAGRGTDYQFQRFGAPFLDSEYFTLQYVPKENEGAKFPKHLGETCYGRDLTKINSERLFTLKWIIEAYEHSTDKSKFFNTKNFTAHAGTALLQEQIEAGLSEPQIRKSWQEDLDAFRTTRAKYLLYD